MFGKGKNQRNKLQQRRMDKSQFGVCVCSQCNYSIAHKRGVPCSTLVCPKCNIPLTRQALSENSSQQEAPKKNNKNTSFPVIDAEICIGCEACVSICPSDAIQMEDGIAKINTENCRKCRACVKACPVGAIK